VIDGDGGMTGERGEDVGILRPEPVAALRRVEVQRADRLASEDERRADHRAEVVLVERARPMRVRRVVVHPDRPLAQDRLGGHSLAEIHLEPEQVGRSLRYRHDPEPVSLAVPEEHVAAVRPEQGSRILDDRG
jgi:hypothetical protein